MKTFRQSDTVTLALRVALAAGLGWWGATTLRAYDSPGGQKTVPPHDRAWIEEQTPDVRTIFNWKFSSEADRVREAGALLDAPDGFSRVMADSGAFGLARIEAAATPSLKGGGRALAEAGRFGSGLRLEGGGYAEGALALGKFLRSERGLTIDFWFRPAGKAGAAGEVLLALHAAAGDDPAAMLLRTDDAVSLVAGGEKRLSVPLAGPPERWRHLVLTIACPDVGEPSSATLVADAHRADSGERPEWLRGFDKLLGQRLTAGGAPGRTGLRGDLDEVRLSRGVRHFYTLDFLAQEAAFAAAGPVPVAPPYFRSDRVRLRLSFDGTLKPEAFDGTRSQGEARARTFRQGVRGEALDLSQIDKAGFALDGTDLFPDLRGTVEFWMRPLDWHNFYIGDYHGIDVGKLSLMGLRPPDALRYGHDEKSRPTQQVTVRLGRSGGSARYPWTKIHPGAWMHVAIVSWGRDRKQNAVYLNGIPRGHVSAEFSDSLRGNARRDDDAFGPGELAFEPSATLIDEFSAYPWVMNRDEAWNLYARWLPASERNLRPMPPFLATFSYRAHNWDNREDLRVSVSCLPVGGVRPAALEAAVLDAAGQEVGRTGREALNDTGNATFSIVGALPFGEYSVAFRLFDAAGKPVKTETATYTRERPEWYGNTLGLERTVPAPWTPMRVTARTIGLWGRELELGDSGLPARITTLGRDVLAGPVAVRVAGPDGAADLRGRDLAFTETAEDRVAWRATLAGAGVRAELEASMEFDGLIVCALTLLPEDGAAARVEALHVDFPMNPAETGQLIANGGGSSFRSSWVARSIPAGEGRVWDGLTGPDKRFGRALKNFLPHMWLGGDIAGLYFGGENDQGWTLDGDHPAQEVRREGGAVVFRMNVIREPVTIGKEGRRFHFVILPTPAKPEPADWRTRLRDPDGPWPRYWFGAMDVFGGFRLNENPDSPGGGASALEPQSWEHAAVMSAMLREKQGLTVLMANASYPGPGPGFRDWNHDLWAGTGRVAWTPEFVDYVAWAMNQYLERDVIDGVYFDDVSVGRTLSLAATAYTLPDGTRRMGFTALAQRRLLLRLWRLFLAHGKEPEIALHMTYCYEVPLFSFARYLFNGEVFDGASYTNNRSFMDVWPPDLLRVLAGAAKWGAGWQWVTHGVGSKDAQWAYYQNRALQGNYMSADVLSETIPGGDLLRAGMLAPGVRGYPFWLSHEILTLQAPAGAKVGAAVYAHADRAYVVVTNFEHKEHEATLQVVEKALFPHAAGGVVWRDIDTELQPPQLNAASREERQRLAKGPPVRGLDDDHEGLPLDEEGLANLLEGSDATERTQKRLVFRPDQDPVRVLIRPRDYRILEVRPKGRGGE